MVCFWNENLKFIEWSNVIYWYSFKILVELKNNWIVSCAMISLSPCIIPLLGELVFLPLETINIEFISPITSLNPFCGSKNEKEYFHGGDYFRCAIFPINYNWQVMYANCLKVPQYFVINITSLFQNKPIFIFDFQLKLWSQQNFL